MTQVWAYAHPNVGHHLVDALPLPFWTQSLLNMHLFVDAPMYLGLYAYTTVEAVGSRHSLRLHVPI